MKMTSKLKWYLFSSGSAPQLSNSQGALISVLDACLVNGYNIQNVSSISKDGLYITFNFLNPHGYLDYQVIELSEFVDPLLRGEHRIISSTSTSVTIELSGVLNIAGSGKCKLAPLGFEIKYQAIGKRAYRSINTLKNPFYLRVDDTLDPVWNSSYAKFAKVAIVENMNGIELENIIGYQAPFNPSSPNDNWIGSGSGASAINGWAKWYYAYALGFASSYTDVSAPASGNFQWLIVGDDEGFYFLPASYTDTTSTVYAFGLFESFLNNDNFNCFLNATFIRNTANSVGYKDNFTGMLKQNVANTIVLRNKLQEATYATVQTIGIGISTGITTGSQNILSPVNQAQFSEVFFNEGGMIRGKPSNYYWLYNQRPYPHLARFVQQGNIYISCNVASNNNIVGQVVLKIGEL